jgi:hypothetical protein
MGWLYSTKWPTRKDLEDHLLEDSRKTGRYIAHKWVGSNFWFVEKMVGDSKPIIVLCLTGKHKNIGYGSVSGSGYGYKDMTEQMGPYYYDCPLDFLEKAPVACQEWRDKVVAFHENEKRYKAMKKQLQVGTVILLKDCKIPEVTLTKIKPMRGVYGGVTYRISPKILKSAEIKTNQTIDIEPKEGLQATIDCVPYPVTRDKDNLTGNWFTIENFVGIAGIESVKRHNPYGESQGILDGCTVYFDEKFISVNCEEFETFLHICHYILDAYDSVGWELLGKINP